MTKIYLNNKIIDLSSDQETKRLEEVAADKKAKDARVAEATTEANNKASAQNKLKALGLTDAEIEAL
jgi:hypothetical protein